MTLIPSPRPPPVGVVGSGSVFLRAVISEISGSEEFASLLLSYRALNRTVRWKAGLDHTSDPLSKKDYLDRKE